MSASGNTPPRLFFPSNPESTRLKGYDAELVLVCGREMIAANIARMADEIARDYPNTTATTPVMLINVLEGGSIMAADLARALADRHVHADFLSVRAKTDWSEPSQPVVRIIMGADVQDKLADKHGILVDEISDSGRTLLELSRALEGRGAASIRSAVMVQRELDGIEPAYRPNYVGAIYAGHEWLGGYGLDADGMLRNLPDIYAMPDTGKAA